MIKHNKFTKNKVNKWLLILVVSTLVIFFFHQPSSSNPAVYLPTVKTANACQCTCIGVSGVGSGSFCEPNNTCATCPGNNCTGSCGGGGGSSQNSLGNLVMSFSNTQVVSGQTVTVSVTGSGGNPNCSLCVPDFANAGTSPTRGILAGAGLTSCSGGSPSGSTWSYTCTGGTVGTYTATATNYKATGGNPFCDYSQATANCSTSNLTYSVIPPTPPSPGPFSVHNYPTPTACSGSNTNPYIQFYWDAATNMNYDGAYQIYRNGSYYATLGGNITSYTDQPYDPNTNPNGVMAGKNYSYQVYAINDGGTTWSLNDTGWITAATCIPPIPTNVKATNLACTDLQPNVQISWDASTGATYYIISRGATLLTCKHGRGCTDVTTSPYIDSTASTNTSYKYTVNACNDSRCSSKSLNASVTTFYCTPPNVTLSIPPPPGQTCLSPAGLGINSASATDTSLSGISSESFALYDDTNPASPTQVGTPISASLYSGSSKNGVWQNTSQAFPTSSMTTGHNYYVVGSAIDNEGNSASSPQKNIFEFDANKCVDPYIKTQNGDVHSNQGISAPGGPQ